MYLDMYVEHVLSTMIYLCTLGTRYVPWFVYRPQSDRYIINGFTFCILLLLYTMYI